MLLRNFVYLPVIGQPVPFTLPDRAWLDEAALPYLEDLIDSRIFEYLPTQHLLWDDARARMVMDENGKLRGKPANQIATRLAEEAFRKQHRESKQLGRSVSDDLFEAWVGRTLPIVGDVFLVGGVSDGTARPYVKPGLSQAAQLSLSHDVLKMPTNQVYAGATLAEAVRTAHEAITQSFEQKPKSKNFEFVDFIEDLRKGRVVDMREGRPLTYCRVPKHEIFRWNLPVYDFGGTLEENEPDFIGRDVLDELDEVIDDFGIFGNANLRLPHEDCVFMFRCTNVDLGDGAYNLRCLIRLRAPDQSGVGGNAPLYMSMFLNSGDQWRLFFELDEGNPNLDPRKDGLADLFLGVTLYAAALLQAWSMDSAGIPVIEPPSERLDSVNKKRRLLARPLLMKTRVIHLSQQRVVRLREQLQDRRRSREVGRHERHITDREIVARRRRKDGSVLEYSYRKRAQTIVVNKHRPAAKDGGLKHPLPMTPTITNVVR